MNSTEPFGLPSGTVRAILALLVIGAAVVAYLNPAATQDARTFLGGLAGVAFGYYFANRQSENTQIAEQRVENQTIAATVEDEAPEERRIVAGE